jgi:peptide/nickel transport system substrate-binding protein
MMDNGVEKRRSQMNRVKWTRQILRWLGLGLGVCSLLLMVACAPTLHLNQLVLSVLSDPKTFNAILSQESPNVFGLIYDGLITENPITTKIEPALAESWEISPDKLSIIFTLREGLQWSDGQPLTVDDVDFSYNQLYLNPKIPNNYRDNFRVGRSRSFPTIRKLDERRIEFKITEPFAPFLENAQVPILPAHILRKSVETLDSQGKPLFLSTWGTDTPPDKIIVSGAYQLKSYFTSQRVIFAKNPLYWKRKALNQPLPFIERVIWAIVESTDTALVQFRSGSLDSVSVSPDYYSLIKQEEERGNFKIYNGGSAYGASFLTFNLNKGKIKGKPLVDPIKSAWFNNLNFRQAIAYAIDRDRMINNIYRGLGVPQNSLVSVQSPFYNRSLKGYRFNLEQSKALLIAGGFSYRNDGTLLDAQGHEVRFTLSTNAGNKIREAMGSQIKEDLAKIGIKVDFSPLAFNVLVNKLSNSLDWEAMIMGLTGGNEPHAPNVWYVDGNLHMFNQDTQRGSPPLSGRVVAPWEQEIEDLSIKGTQVIAFEERKPVYDKIQQVAQEYLPFIYLVNPYSLSAVRNCFEPIKYSALGGAFWNLDQQVNICYQKAQGIKTSEGRFLERSSALVAGPTVQLSD